MMAIDPGVLSSIAALVEQDAGNVALRLHLADLLLANGAAGRGPRARGHRSRRTP
jgi:hypothetical protein